MSKEEKENLICHRIVVHNHDNAKDCPACQECKRMIKFYKEKCDLYAKISQDAVNAMMGARESSGRQILFMQNILDLQKCEIERLVVECLTED